MGGGRWTNASYNNMSATRGYKTKSTRQIFAKKAKKEMMPIGVELRESRDSDEHPNSLAVMVWLDVTGSMGYIPTNFVKESMPHLMMGIMDAGIADPQVFFGAIGDHRTDRHPLQIGQFESSTEKIDKWLTNTYLESGGGGNGGESYLLAWYFAGNHTSTDCWEKRGQKGFLITIGDEACHPEVSGYFLQNQMGKGEFAESYSAKELLEKAQETYNVYHIHANDGSYRDNDYVIGGWRNLLGENLIVVQNHGDIATKIAEIVAGGVTTNTPINATESVNDETEEIL